VSVINARPSTSNGKSIYQSHIHVSEHALDGGSVLVMKNNVRGSQCLQMAFLFPSLVTLRALNIFQMDWTGHNLTALATTLLADYILPVHSSCLHILFLFPLHSTLFNVGTYNLQIPWVPGVT